MAQFGFKTETSAGTTVTVDKFSTFLEEDFDLSAPAVESDAHRAGRIVRHRDESNGGNIEVGGSVSYELATAGQAVLWKHKMGAVNTSSLGGGLYSHVYTPSYTAGLAATLQFGVNTDPVTAQPKTISGAVASTWEVAGEEGAFLTCSDEWVGMRAEVGTRTLSGGATTDESATLTATGLLASDIGKSVSGTGIPDGTYITDVADDLATATMSAAATADGSGLSIVVGKPLASPSYASGAHYYKLHMARLSIGGSDVPMKSFTIAGDNKVEADFYAGSRWSRIAKPTGDLRDYTGSVNLEYASNDQYDRYLAGEVFDIDIVAAYGSSSITFNLEGRYDESLVPMQSGRGRTMQEAPFHCLGNASDASGITVTVVTTEASAA